MSEPGKNFDADLAQKIKVEMSSRVGLIGAIFAAGLVGLAIVGIASRSSGERSDARAREVVDQLSPNWEKLGDGSSFAVVRRGGPGEAYEGATAVRCWAETGAELCLYADQGKYLGLRSELSIRRSDEKPGIVMGAGTSNGYSCHTSAGHVVEAISRENSTLLSNEIGFDRTSWSQGYVREFLRDNKVDGEWFDCNRLIRIVHSGSVETLSTTAITRSMLPK